MIVHLDTSVLIDALVAPWRSFDALERALEERHELAISAPVLFEWLRGPRTSTERASLREWILDDHIAPFDADAAATAASLYAAVARSHQREADIAIAACAIEHNAALWTLNVDDFSDIPGLRLYRPI